MLAPMAGMSDLPYREICRAHGAGYAVGEMTTCQPQFRTSRKSATRWACDAELGLRVVQLLGADPAMMADAARYAEDSGAQVVDINMGCPAKKVLQTACGSALMKDEALVARILEAVCAAVSVPVTLKIRTGWDREHRNALAIAGIAEQTGVAMLTIHGRTREDGFRGEAEYETIRTVKAAVSIPVIANGDIWKPEDAERILLHTGADMAMIGRGCFGNPWIFQQAKAVLEGLPVPPLPPLAERCETAVRQIRMAASYKGERVAVLEARKQYCWYLKGIPHANYYKEQIVQMNTLEDVDRITKGIQRDLRD